MKASAATVQKLQAERDKREREDLVAAAIGDGRIPPARKEHWLKSLAADYEGTKTVLEGLEPGLVPLDERGSGQGQEVLASEASKVEQWTQDLFPEVRSRKQQEAALAANGKSSAYPTIMHEEG